MQQIITVGIAGGLMGVLMSYSSIPAAAFVGSLLAPLPFAVAGFKLSWRSGLAAMALAALLVAVASSLLGKPPLPSLLYFIGCFAGPSLFLAHQALRTEAHFSLPLSVSLVGLFISTFHVLVVINSGESIEEISAHVTNTIIQALPHKDIKAEEALRLAITFFPTFTSLGLLSLILFSLHVTRHWLEKKGHITLKSLNLLIVTDIPVWAYWMFGTLLAATLYAPEPWAFAAKNLAPMAFLPMVLTGVAIVHLACQPIRYRSIALSAFYVVSLLIGWPSFVLMGGLGLVEPWIHLQEKLKSRQELGD